MSFPTSMLFSLSLHVALPIFSHASFHAFSAIVRGLFALSCEFSCLLSLVGGLFALSCKFACVCSLRSRPFRTFLLVCMLFQLSISLFSFLHFLQFFTLFQSSF